jgi:peptidoglycan L-alanyl-D-glutamate endopeptidase CwlK
MEQGVSLTWGGVWDRRLNDLPADADGIEAAVKAYCARHPGPDFIDGPHYELAA